MTVRRSQTERREQAEARLLAAALTLVAQRGTHAMTLADVGTAAGFSRSLPAFYFGSKQGLVQRLLAHIHAQHAAERAAAAPAAPGLDAVLAAIDVYFIRRDPTRLSTRALFALMAEALNPRSELQPDVAAYLREARVYLAGQIAIGIDRRQIRADVEPDRAAALILAGLRGTMIQWLISPSLIALTDARDQMRAIVRRTLATTAPGLVPARPSSLSVMER